MASDRRMNLATFGNLPLLEVAEFTTFTNQDSDAEEIEAEPRVRQDENPSSHLTPPEGSISTFPKEATPTDTLEQQTSTSESSNLSCDFQLPKTDEFRERRRTTYSFSSPLSKLKKEKIGPITSKIISENTPPSAGFSCNICFDTACNPVLTLCGHLFCWPCLHRWLSSQYKNPLCPVCKAGCGKDKVIPVYGRGSDEKDPRHLEPIPERPKGQRPKPEPTLGYGNWSRVFGRGLDSGLGEPEASALNFHAGFGFFPSLTFQYTPENGAQFHTHTGSPQQAFLFRLFLMLSILVFIANLG